VSLHNGVIQLWDYRVGTVVDRFEEHEGPVRGVDFHSVDSLICSGGDDYKIKVWDYKLKRCLFTLLGHLDYIRTVQFHNEHPWILSASDDQTIRLWNWQERSCMSVLTGHNHYVMCAAFHPREDLIVSASLDQTVRVWDTAGLRKKQSSSPSLGLGFDDTMRPKSGSGLNMQAELFGTNDVIVKYVLEGHDRGVNWASFHPTLPLLVSAADDRQVKLWRMSETKAWEVDTMRGHTNNVSCVMFHPKNELIVSNSEDRSIRIWDMSKRVGVQTFRRENDRFWILAAHKHQNLLAAGHDSGMIVFKLERERPAHDVSLGDGRLYYVKGRELLVHDYGTGREMPIANLKRPGQYAQTDGIGNSPRYLAFNSFNPTEGNVLVCSTVDGGNYELVSFNLGSSNSGNTQEGKRGTCVGPAVFVARNRFAILDKNRSIVIKNLQNETTKKVSPPTAAVDMMFNGGTAGRVLLRAEDKLILFETQSRRVLGEITAPKVKMVSWSPDGSKVAIICKYGVLMADRNMEQLCSISETVRMKSGAWDSSSKLFIYTTLNHIKYCIPNGDTGIIRTLDAPIYVTKVHKKQLFCLDREGKARVLSIDTTEAVFKLALENKKYGQVMEMVRKSRLCGKAIIGYLKSKGFPEVALHFVKEPRTRFNLALACGNIEVAMETAFTLEQEEGSSECWHDLGVEALKQGNHQVVEMAYQRTKDFDRLSFLYLLSGNTEKLKKMLKISEVRGDVMGRFQNALFLGDIEERVKVLESSGNLNLAYVSAKVHGLEEHAERIKGAIEAAGGELPEVKGGASLLQPPTPIVRSDNWPTLEIEKNSLENLGDVGGDNDDHEEANGNGTAAHLQNGGDGNWGENDDLDFGEANGGAGGDDDIDDDFADGDGGWGDDDLDLGDDDGGGATSPTKKDEDVATMDAGGFFSAPKAGTPATSKWVSNSSHAADHSAAGSVETAMQLLNRQIAATNFDCIKDKFLMSYVGACVSIPGLPGTPSMRINPERAPGLPVQVYTLQSALNSLKQAYAYFRGGKFADAAGTFKDILLVVPMIVVDSRAEASQVKELLETSREYITAIRIKGAMGESAADPARTTELSAYFTHCNMQPAHLLLALRSAMGTSFKHKNFIAAASFARRLLELPEVSSEKNADLKVKATKVLQKSEQQARNEHDLIYDEFKAFAIDCQKLTPIYVGEQSVKCSFCGSAYGPEFKGKMCNTCGLCKVGVETLGLVSMSSYGGS